MPALILSLPNYCWTVLKRIDFSVLISVKTYIFEFKVPRNVYANYIVTRK